MEQKTISEGIKKVTDEMADATMGKDTSNKVGELAQRESPLDEVRRLNRETKELVSELTKVKDDLTNLAAYTQLSGRAVNVAKKELTDDEVKQEAVDQMKNLLIRDYVK